VTTENQRLFIRWLNAETIQLEATPTMLLSFVALLLSLAQGDPTYGYDTSLMGGVQLDEGSASLLVHRVSDERAHSRDHNPVSPDKLEPLEIVPGYDDLQLNASKDGLIYLSRKLIDIVKYKTAESHLVAGKEFGVGSLALTVQFVPEEGA
jgi:hypothetical protein